MADDDRVLAMLCHLLAIFTSFIGPLIIWLVKRGSSPMVDEHGKAVLNFQITVLIAYVALLVVGVILGIFVPFLFILFGVIWAIVGVAVLVLLIIGTIKASKGEDVTYPLSLHIIK